MMSFPRYSYYCAFSYLQFPGNLGSSRLPHKKFKSCIDQFGTGCCYCIGPEIIVVSCPRMSLGRALKACAKKWPRVICIMRFLGKKNVGSLQLLCCALWLPGHADLWPKAKKVLININTNTHIVVLEIPIPILNYEIQWSMPIPILCLLGIYWQ